MLLMKMLFFFIINFYVVAVPGFILFNIANSYFGKSDVTVGVFASIGITLLIANHYLVMYQTEKGSSYFKGWRTGIFQVKGCILLMLGR